MANLPIEQSKTVLSSSIVILHGIEVDTLNHIPTNKVTSLRQKLISMAKR